MMTARFERRDLAKAFLGLDLLVTALFAVALMLLVRDAYLAGFYQARDANLYGQAFWAMIRDAVFLVGTLAWIFFRHFRGELQLLKDPWG